MIDPVRILVVDAHDDEANKCIAALEAKGWMVERARSFAEATTLIRESSYNVVIMDVVLPDLLGIEGWRYLKVQRPEMACILTTGSSSLRDSVDAFGQDVLDFALKPLKMDAVCNLIHQVSRHQRISAAKLQREHELSGLSIWLSSIAKASSRRQIFDSSITHLEVILPSNWTVAFLSPDYQLAWLSRSTGYLSAPSLWAPEQTQFIEGIAKRAVQTRKVITQLPSSEFTTDSESACVDNVVVIPLVIETRTHGALVFLKEQREGRLDQAETDFAIVVGKILALALDRVQLAKEWHPLPLQDQLPGAPVGS